MKLKKQILILMESYILWIFYNWIYKEEIMRVLTIKETQYVTTFLCKYMLVLGILISVYWLDI